MGFDVATVDRQFLGNRPRRSDLLEQTLPDAPLGPAIVAVIDRRRWTVGGGYVAPAASRLQYMKNARDHRSIIDPRFARLTVGKMRLDRCPRLIRQPEQIP